MELTGAMTRMPPSHPLEKMTRGIPTELITKAAVRQSRAVKARMCNHCLARRSVLHIPTYVSEAGFRGLSDICWCCFSIQLSEVRHVVADCSFELLGSGLCLALRC